MTTYLVYNEVFCLELLTII